jgi:hypothetical protein
MTANPIEATRTNPVDAFPKLADGLTERASTAPSVVLAGVTFTPGDLVAEVQARIARARAAKAAEASWHGALQADMAEAVALRPLQATMKQVLVAAYRDQVDVLADFGFMARQGSASPSPRAPKKTRIGTMQPLKAIVKNGRIVVDEPTDLPEGEVVYLQPVEADDMSDEERQASHESIRESIDQMNRGQLIDADEAPARLRAHR